MQLGHFCERPRKAGVILAITQQCETFAKGRRSAGQLSPVAVQSFQRSLQATELRFERLQLLIPLFEPLKQQ